jgi:hypothetical protein
MEIHFSADPTDPHASMCEAVVFATEQVTVVAPDVTCSDCLVRLLAHLQRAIGEVAKVLALRVADHRAEIIELRALASRPTLPDKVCARCGAPALKGHEFVERSPLSEAGHMHATYVYKPACAAHANMVNRRTQ